MTARRKPAAASQPAPAQPAQPAAAAPRAALVAVDAPIRTARGTRKPAAPQQRLTALSKRQRGAALPAPVVLHPASPTGPTTVPPQVLPQRGLSAGYDPRFQCAPGEAPALFSRLRIGQYLPDEPKPQPARPPAPAPATPDQTTLQEGPACLKTESSSSPSAPCATAPSTRARRTRKPR